MNLSDELALSYYKPVAYISKEHSVQMVQHVETKKFFVMKQLSCFNLDIYRDLMTNPIPNIPRIYLAAEDGNRLIVIEEYIHGETLQEIISCSGTLPKKTAVDYTIRLCGIISALHNRKPPIVHRDIKPSNIIVSKEGTLNILDMNTAKYEDREQVADTELLGTAGYAAPEQYGFRPSVIQSDIYAVGALLNLMITGKMISEERTKGRLSEIIQKCTKMDPDDRYKNVESLVSDLKNIQAKNNIEKSSSAEARRYIPPGFRSKQLSHMIIASIGYFLILITGATLDIQSNYPAQRALNRIFAILLGFAVVFFTFDYAGIRSRLPLSGSEKIVTKILGIIFYDLVIILIFSLFLSALEMSLFY